MKKNIFAFCFGCLLVMIVLGGVEMFFRFAGVQRKPHVQQVLVSTIDSSVFSEEWKISPELLRDVQNSPFKDWKSLLTKDDPDIRNTEGLERFGPILNCGNCAEFLPAGVYSHKAAGLVSKRLVYEMNFTIDDRGRRITAKAQPGSQKAIVMAGDSYTFGEGINDEHTSPMQLGHLRPDTQVYNMGLSASSPNEFLYEVSRNYDQRYGDIHEKNKIFLFTVMSDHLERMFCRSLCVSGPREFLLRQPWYVDVNGVPTYKGRFSERTTTNFFYRMVQESAFLSYKNVVVPPYFTSSHYDFFCAVLLEARKSIQQRDPSADFYVVFFPQDSQPYANTLAKRCRERGLKVLNYSGVNIAGITNNQERVFGDGHPSPQTNYLFAKLLDRDLPK